MDINDEMRIRDLKNKIAELEIEKEEFLVELNRIETKLSTDVKSN